ncbi:hypothetical protein E2C01_087360 [Portunus trituberculatus]|uniref:Uncharacterized protein n=1 Tax=Portunus trituberculatus TaxID=210409 RepID=A0A5B7J347_PORTR|nr:hypothetical protein [Portunus trituberculatus]
MHFYFTIPATSAVASGSSAATGRPQPNTAPQPPPPLASPASQQPTVSSSPAASALLPCFTVSFSPTASLSCFTASLPRFTDTLSCFTITLSCFTAILSCFTAYLSCFIANFFLPSNPFNLSTTISCWTSTSPYYSIAFPFFNTLYGATSFIHSRGEEEEV